MALVTGTPEGTILQQDELYIEGAPYIYFQDWSAGYLSGPDGDNFYWGLSGTALLPVYELACYEDVSLQDDLTINAVRCDQAGDRALIQKRNHLAFTFTLSTLMPLANIRYLIHGGAVTTTAPYEKMGLGEIAQNQFFHIYLPKVYDTENGHYLSITLHKAQFTQPWTIAMASGDKWALAGIGAWAFADDSLPAGQEFATIIRYDPANIT